MLGKHRHACVQLVILAATATCAAEAEPADAAETGWALVGDAGEQEECLPNVSLLQNSFHLTRTPDLVNVPGSAKKNQFYFVHIPKTAGSSWALDTQKVVSPGYTVVSQEGCYSLHEENPHLEGVMVMLRDPRSHVLSQFNMCQTHWVSAWRNESISAGGPGGQLPGRFEDWVSAWKDLSAQGWRGNFTPSAELLKQGELRSLIREHRLKAWADPPYSPQRGMHVNWKDWPSLDGGGTVWHHTKMPFECYSPLDMQSRRLTCKRPLEYLEPINVADALENLNGSWFVGFAEEYQASVCLFHAKFAHRLPNYCDCSIHAMWKSFHGHKENTKERKFDNRAVSLLPKDLLMSIDELTVIDRYLYKFAWERFVSEARAVKERFGKTVLCDETLPSQRDRQT